LESGEVRRLGSVKANRVDVRVVAATNGDPRQLISQARFRADLYYRLNGITVTLPPLRNRKADILPLANMFIARFSESLGKPPPGLAPSAAETLESYDWPGNIRELRNVMERAVVLCTGDVLEAQDLMLQEAAAAATDSAQSFPDGLNALERKEFRAVQ